jgi:hypothetical protein
VTGLRAELARVGIRGRLASRIVLELEDHLRCDPSADLGAPREIAERFAEELSVPRTRRSTYGGFAALAFASVSILISSSGGGLDAFGARGWIVSLGGLGVVFGGQVSFVSGVLALWDALRRPRTPAELRLVQRRTGVALAAGGFALASHAVQTVAAAPLMSNLWLALAIPASVVPALALGSAAHGLRGAIALTPAARPTARPFPRRLVLAIGAAAVTVMVVGSAFAEHSWVEGLSRGALEAIGFAICFAIFGGRLGIRR